MKSNEDLDRLKTLEALLSGISNKYAILGLGTDEIRDITGSVLRIESVGKDAAGLFGLEWMHYIFDRVRELEETDPEKMYTCWTSRGPYLVGSFLIEEISDAYDGDQELDDFLRDLRYEYGLKTRPLPGGGL